MTPQEKTIWNLAMNGGSVILSDIGRFNLDSEYGNPPESYEPLKINNITLESGKMEICAEHKNGWSVGFIELEEVTPILHSLSQLNETMMQGVTYIDCLWFEVISSNRDCFNKEQFYENCQLGNIELLPIMVLDQLNAWFFNTENLPAEQFIEKSNLKL